MMPQTHCGHFDGNSEQFRKFSNCSLIVLATFQEFSSQLWLVATKLRTVIKYPTITDFITK